jgi:hypothetical protein
MRLLALLGLLALPAGLFAQDKPKEKANPLDKIAGYKRHTIEGFTLLVSDDVAKADTSGYEIKPLAVLEMELAVVTKIMTAKQVETLRKLVLWVEWDDRIDISNGREGSPVAVYSGGHQAHMVRQGWHPLKAKTVTVLRMKSLTEEHQPKRDAGRCVLLHEFAHAVHDQLLGRDHAGVKAAFAQAVERKLYDKTQYLVTNDAEYFAETTCAYFDQLFHYPQTRDDLKKHDPGAHKLMESVWGTAKKPPSANRPKGLLANTGGGEFDLTVSHTPEHLRFGEPVLGGGMTNDALAGCVAVVGFFGEADLPVLSKLATVHHELAAFGAKVVCGPGQLMDEATMRRHLEAKAVPFPAVASLMLRDKDDMTRYVGRKPSHTLVFDADGKCVFRGTGHDAAPHARAAVGRHLLAKLFKADPPKGLAPVADALTSGKPLLEVLPKLNGLTTSSDTDTASGAKQLMATLCAPAVAKLDEAKKLAKADQVAAFLLLEDLPSKYRGCPTGERLGAAVDGLRNTIPVGAELKARTALEAILKMDAALQAQPGGFEPSSPTFRQRNAAGIAQLRAAVEAMRKKHPTAKATERAEKVLQGYGG